MAQPASPSTLGSPVAKSLDPFTGKDLLSAFLSGAVWGGFALAVLGIGAWLVSVMRTRVMATTTRASSTLFAEQRSAPTLPAPSPLDFAAAVQAARDDEESLTTHVMPMDA